MANWMKWTIGAVAIAILGSVGYYVFTPKATVDAAKPSVTETKKPDTPAEDPVAIAKANLTATQKTAEEAQKALTTAEEAAAAATKKAEETPDSDAVAKAEANLEAAKKTAEAVKAKSDFDTAKKNADDAQTAVAAAEKVVSDKRVADADAKKKAEEANATVPKTQLTEAQQKLATAEKALSDAKAAWELEKKDLEGKLKVAEEASLAKIAEHPGYILVVGERDRLKAHGESVIPLLQKGIVLLAKGYGAKDATERQQLLDEYAKIDAELAKIAANGTPTKK